MNNLSRKSAGFLLFDDRIGDRAQALDMAGRRGVPNASARAFERVALSLADGSRSAARRATLRSTSRR